MLVVFVAVARAPMPCVTAAESTKAAAAQWTQFRGANGDGISAAVGLPVTFGEGSPEIAWKTAVPGRAWSSPVVWGNQIWVTNAPEEIHNPPGATEKQSAPENVPALETPVRLSVVCLDFEHGTIVHDITVFEVDRPQYTHLTNSYASPTPCIEEGRVYVHFGTYGTACLDTETGKILWQRDDLNVLHWRGPGSSPVIHGNLLYLCFDGYDRQFIAALDKRTGKTVWQKDREIDYGTDNGDRKKAYATPQVISVNGRDLLVSPFAMATIAYDAKTGDNVWIVNHGGMNAAARPLVGNGLVYINAGDGHDALIAVRPDGSGDVTETHVAWRQGKMTPKRPSQLLIGDLYFMINDDAIATCLNALTGEIIWKDRLLGRFWSSPVYADGMIYDCSQQGTVFVFKAGRKFELVARNQFDDGFNASPAIAGDSMILRSMSHVYRIRKPTR